MFPRSDFGNQALLIFVAHRLYCKTFNTLANISSGVPFPPRTLYAIEECLCDKRRTDAQDYGRICGQFRWIGQVFPVMDKRWLVFSEEENI